MKFSHFTKATAILWLTFLTLATTTMAQLPKRGKPNMDAYKADISRAKKGDVAAMLTVAAAFRGDMLTDDAFKDYRNALRWYQKAAMSNPTAEQQFTIKFNLFQLYFVGGYGIKQDLALAKMNHAEACALNPLPLISDYMPNLYLKDFFQAYEEAQTGDTNAALRAAMMSYRYKIHYPTAVQLLDRAAGQPDAAYLANRYEAELLKFRQSGNANLDRAQLFEILRRHAQQGSMLAKTELAFEALKPSQFAGQRLKTEEAVALFNQIEQQWKTAYAAEMQLKALCLLAKYQNGNDKIMTLRRLSAIKTNLQADELGFAEPLFNELKSFEQKAATIEGLAELQQTYGLTGFKIDADLWRNHFNGEVRQLLAFKTELEKPVIRQLVGDSNANAYQIQLQRKCAEVLRQASSPRRAIAFYEELKQNKWLQSITPPLAEALQLRFAQLGIDSTNMPFFYAQGTIEDTRFNNINEGKAFISNLLNSLPKPQPMPRNLSRADRTVWEANNRRIIAEQMRLTNFAKSKIIRDIVGEAPTVEQIERAKPMLLFDPWLQPEGERMFFYYTSDSPNWFSGDIKRGNTFYYYKVKRIGTSNRFRLEIQAVVNDKSNLVFNSIVRTNRSSDGIIEVDVLGSRMTGYSWNISENDYLTCIFRQNQSTLDLQPFGYISRSIDRNHGYPQDFPRQKVVPQEFSERNAIRSAIRAFILEYHSALKPI
ncbi:hypothetical protein [Rhodoflexus sp.]